ncbi:hypothetical protein [Sphingorhabdus sp. YGSMI21]|uniref:hypothetical protein n=1 Tax=Sphingorhabdus sp. YGSMI21 TaxID=2077182 RepID=UPI000C1DE44C|nr:hypothetical protein [Sphingorhabdus sp. YGSMI21]ATW04942.1 hypothetical protein CHN51_16455 [Sphingorhabdus sp. YGSMI21]
MAVVEKPSPHLQYQSLLINIRARYEIINNLHPDANSDFAVLETSAFHMRKSIEGVAFSCLVALDNGLKQIPKDARGQWNADKIFAKLSKQKELVFPESFKRETPPEGSDPRVSHYIVKRPEINLTVDDVRAIYRRSHKWLHEWNPYVESLGRDFEKSKAELLSDLPKIWDWLLQHLIGIGGKVFLGLLKDGPNEEVRVVAAESANLDEY